jgi:hypothetical protein
MNRSEGRQRAAIKNNGPIHALSCSAFALPFVLTLGVMFIGVLVFPYEPTKMRVLNVAEISLQERRSVWWAIVPKASSRINTNYIFILILERHRIWTVSHDSNWCHHRHPSLVLLCSLSRYFRGVNLSRPLILSQFS